VEGLKEGTKYIGSYSLVCSVQPEKAIAKYANGMLIAMSRARSPFKEA
jgi:hypothetical protein